MNKITILSAMLLAAVLCGDSYAQRVTQTCPPGPRCVPVQQQTGRRAKLFGCWSCQLWYQIYLAQCDEIDKLTKQRDAAVMERDDARKHVGELTKEVAALKADLTAQREENEQLKGIVAELETAQANTKKAILDWSKARSVFAEAEEALLQHARE